MTAGTELDFLSVTSDGLRLRLRVTPKAAKDAVEGPLAQSDGTRLLGVRVRAAPDKGAANAAVEKVLARWLGVAGSTVRVVKGHTARIKSVEIAGDGPALLQRAKAELRTA
ncbi:DUF167 domain-containing protein [Tepidamorphus sp. 3E244]|uniref:DUF167 domain-containing protein n=1 Tax=Tepidamorphus sp. 3E244 TaxID=3385498 RepID=UPI0038FC9A50